MKLVAKSSKDIVLKNSDGIELLKILSENVLDKPER